MTSTSSITWANDRRWGFGLAVAAHAVIFALGSLAWQHRAEYGMDPSQGAIDVELVAAPPSEAPKPVAVTPPAPVIIPDANDVIQPAKMPVPQPVATAAPSTAAAPAVPGTDAITLHHRGGSEALLKPGYQRNPPPPYPAEARRLKQEGRVLLSVSVTAEGRVDAARIQQTSGFPLLDEAALHGVQNWRFRAASVGGLHVASEVEIPIRFQLK